VVEGRGPSPKFLSVPQFLTAPDSFPDERDMLTRRGLIVVDSPSPRPSPPGEGEDMVCSTLIGNKSSQAHGLHFWLPMKPGGRRSQAGVAPT
jgi:hypothetical protein